jgi:putative phosphoribosyl transferase
MEMFRNRKEAGYLLGKALEKYKTEKPIVLAVPRGGVETGYCVASHLNCELSVIIARKLGYPEQPESAFGAVAEDGSLYLNPWIKRRLSREDIILVRNREESVVERRVKLYRKGEPLPNMKNRTVILVDDGIATGASLLACIEACRKRQPDKIVVAAPVAGKNMKDRLITRADDVVILSTPENFYVVSQAYEHFESVSDEEAIRLLNMRKSMNDFKDQLTLIN